jgi:ketosteroid isomerase-like protein
MPSPAPLSLDEQLYARFLEHDPQATAKPLERSNVLMLQRLFAALVQGNLQPLVASFAEDIDWEIFAPAVVPFGGACRGREQAALALQKNFGAWQIVQGEIRDVIAQGNQVVVVGYDRGLFKPLGRSVEVNYVQVFTIVDGKIVKFREFADTIALEKQLSRGEA